METIKGEAQALGEDMAKTLTYGTHYTAGKGIKERLEDYAGFLARLRSHGADAPKTTDDCFTPPHIYAAVVEWLAGRVSLEGRRIVRPFVPGGDFEAFPYEAGDIVVDNPPFSILARIKRFYLSRGMPIFLFAPGLTLWSNTAAGGGLTYVVTGYTPAFENGAKIQVGFVTNLFPGTRIIVAPSLAAAMREAEEREGKKKAERKVAKYVYPPEVWSPATLGTLAKNGGFDDIVIPEASSRLLHSLAQQRLYKKAFYGGGVMVDRGTAARLIEAKAKAKAEAKAEAEAEAEAVTWQMTAEELAELDRLDAEAAKLAAAGEKP